MLSPCVTNTSPRPHSYLPTFSYRCHTATGRPISSRAPPVTSSGDPQAKPPINGKWCGARTRLHSRSRPVPHATRSARACPPCQDDPWHRSRRSRPSGWSARVAGCGRLASAESLHRPLPLECPTCLSPDAERTRNTHHPNRLLRQITSPRGQERCVIPATLLPAARHLYGKATYRFPQSLRASAQPTYCP